VEFDERSEFKPNYGGCRDRNGGAQTDPAMERRSKRDVVLRLLRGESIEVISRQTAVEAYRLEQWRERALAGLDAGLAAALEHASQPDI
jgi:hypothetical protein